MKLKTTQKFFDFNKGGLRVPRPEFWGVFYTTASTPTTVSFHTRMPVGEVLRFDFGEGPASQYETVGINDSQSTSHTYIDPKPGIKITIADENNIQFLRSFDMSDMFLKGIPPKMIGFADLSYCFCKNNQLHGSPPALSGSTNLDYFFAGGNSMTGNLPPLVGLPDLLEYDVDDSSLVGFDGGFTLRSERAGAFKLRIRNNQLTQDAVDKILIDALAASFATNDVLSLNEGLNSPPSAAGLAAKDELTAAGCYVAVNT